MLYGTPLFSGEPDVVERAILAERPVSFPVFSKASKRIGDPAVSFMAVRLRFSV